VVKKASKRLPSSTFNVLLEGGKYASLTKDTPIAKQADLDAYVEETKAEPQPSPEKHPKLKRSGDEVVRDVRAEVDRQMYVRDITRAAEGSRGSSARERL
jgi:hypothetical protein